MEVGHVTYAQLTLPSPHRDGGHHHPFNQHHPRGKCASKDNTKSIYTGSLAPANFSGAVFTCEHFQKSSNMFGSCNFPYRNSFTPTHFCILWLLMTSLMYIWFIHIFARPKKPRNWKTNKISSPNRQLSKQGIWPYSSEWNWIVWFA